MPLYFDSYPIERIRAHQRYAYEYFRAFLPAL
jgi:hypothetical protein